DRYSLLVDNRRLVLWSGEVHPFRLPSPSLWRDVLQKLRAHGHNAVTVPVAWNYHSPAPGEHDFSGVRNLDLFLRTAAEERLYVVLRPGPHLGADLDAGGLPGWLTATGVTARTDDPEYLRHADAWLGAVNSVAVRHLYTAGRGTVLLYQLEDARDAAPAEARAATERLYARLRADRIDVPVFRTGGTPDAAGEPWLYAVDADTAPDRVPADPVRLAGGAASRPRTPGIVASSAAGAADPWGGAASGGKGYGEVRRIRDAAHQRRTTLTHLAGGITVHNARTAFGGTSWGWLPGTNVYNSYDHGAAVDEARRASPQLAPTPPPGQPRHRRPGVRPAQRLRRAGHHRPAGHRRRRPGERRTAGRQAAPRGRPAGAPQAGLLHRAAHAQHDRRPARPRRVRGPPRRDGAGRAGLRLPAAHQPPGRGARVVLRPGPAQRGRAARGGRTGPGAGGERRLRHAHGAAVRGRRGRAADVALRDAVRPAAGPRPRPAAVGHRARLHPPPHRGH